MRMFVAIFMVLALGTLTVTGSVRADAPSAIDRPLQNAGASSEIVVKGVRGKPVSRAPDRFVLQAAEARQASADAQFFGRCIKPWKNPQLHELIDSPPGSTIREYALDKIIRENSACYPNFVAEPAEPAPYYGDCNVRGRPVIEYDPLNHKVPVGVHYDYAVCQAFFDRGALIEKALSTYVPNLSFTTQQLFIPQVLERFHAREDTFNARRPKEERVFAEVVTCLVAMNPDIALDYLKTRAATADETRLRDTMISTTPQCLGGANRAQVDPAQFRVFMADAIYSWALALKGGSTLIPLSTSHGMTVKGRKSSF